MGTPRHIFNLHQAFFDFWTENRLPSDRVRDKSVDPKLLKLLLPNLAKIRLGQNGPGFSLVGTNIAEEYQTDFTGKLVTEHPYPICREIYLTLIERMDMQPGYKICYGYFCYNERQYLRTMEATFPLESDAGDASGYLVLVSVDHGAYKDKLYLPEMPIDATAKYADVVTQDDFEDAMERYRTLKL